MFHKLIALVIHYQLFLIAFINLQLLSFPSILCFSITCTKFCLFLNPNLQTITLSHSYRPLSNYSHRFLPRISSPTKSTHARKAQTKAQVNRLRYRSRVNGATRASLTLYTTGSFGNHDVMCRRRRAAIFAASSSSRRGPRKQRAREILSRSRFYELFFSASSFGPGWRGKHTSEMVKVEASVQREKCGCLR